MESFWEYALVVLAATAGFTIAGVGGFGGGVTMLPILVWMLGIKEAIPVLTITQLMGSASRVWLNRREVDWSVVRWFTLGAIPLAVVGSFVFVSAQSSLLTRLLGGLLIFMVVQRHTAWSRYLKPKLWAFTPIGAVSGFIAATLGAAGPLVAPFFLAYGLVKGAYIGTAAFGVVVGQFPKLAVFGSNGLLSLDNVLLGFALGIAAFAGSYLGSRILRFVPERVFPYIIEAVMIAAAVMFFVRG